MADRIAVCTGSNKGIGFAIVKNLCQNFGGIVYLTARNAELGNKSLESLKQSLQSKKCKELRFHPLDITDKTSVVQLKDYLLKEHGGLDILINNAGIAYELATTAPFSEEAQVTIATNYTGTKQACEILFPILRPHARVVNVSSTTGLLKQVTSEELRSKFLSKSLTVKELDKLVDDFVKFAQTGDHLKMGYSGCAYGMSKVALTALTFIQQRMFNSDERPDLIVNACCPGYVDTDLTSHRGHLTPDQGAETPVYLALLPENIERPKGAFVYLKQETDWITGDFLQNSLFDSSYFFFRRIVNSFC